MEHKAMSKSRFDQFKEIFSWVMLITMAICATLAIFRMVKMQTTGEQAFLFDHRPVLVLTGSMEPYMMTNSLCLTRAIEDPSDVQIGDVVSFHMNTNDGDTLRITHRIIDIQDGLYYTKGDNNSVDDGFGIPFENLEAKVVGVWNGAVPVVNLAFWFAGKWDDGLSGKLICVSGAVVVICAYNLICILFETLWGLITGKRKDREDAPSQEESPTFVSSTPESTE